MDDIDKNIEKYNPNKKQKILIVFDDMITDILGNKKLNLIAIELFIKSRKLNTSVISIILSSSAVHLLKILNKQELQQMAFTHSSDIDLREFMNLYKECTAKNHPKIILHISERIFFERV